MNVRAGAKIAVVGADAAFHARLRASLGLAPGAGVVTPRRRLAYCGAEYRVYPSMRIDEAIRFYSAMNDRWDAERLAADLDVAGLRGSFEVRRMKRAFQRALVLAFGVAAEPELVVVESAEEFDEPAALRLLASTLERAPASLVTYGGDARPEPGIDPATVIGVRDFAIETFS